MSDVVDRLNAALEGRYAIERELGEGGMAMVYLANDLRHNRRVALKVLKPELAAVVGAERFLAEIETTANLQHPHILPLFDSGEAAGFLFFVMPYIDGETLRDKLDREKQLPVDEAVGIATAVASALSVAHEQGVIHRDVKPANILLSRGEPLVSDFGIAIAVTNSSGARLTETGLSVGTPYYMSPEQATGDREITAASDVYALGCVLYEMLVGEPPYVGSTAQAVLGKILTEKPRSPSAVRAVVPPNVEGAVLRALEKLPADRFTSASGFVRALTDASFRYGQTAEVANGGAAAGGRWKSVALTLAVVSAVLFVNMLRTALAPEDPPPPPAVFDLDFGDLALRDGMAVSRQGDAFAVAARAPGDATSRLWVRRLDETEFRPVQGTEYALWVDFSPDGEWLVFRNLRRNALLKVALSGGGALPILEVDSIRPHDPYWGAGGTIVFTSPEGLWRVSETGEGGAHRLAASLDGRAPTVLPDGSGALASDGRTIYFVDFETDSARAVIPDGVLPRYVNTGHIVYAAVSGGLFAVPFDLATKEVTGLPTPVRDGVATGASSAPYDISDNGVLFFRQGDGEGGAAGQAPDHRLVFLDRAGRPDTVPLTPRPIWSPRVSPDGRYVAYDTRVVGGGQDHQIQVLDLATGSSPEVTVEGDNRWPIWSPDGTMLAFASTREGTRSADLYTVPADGSAPPTQVLRRENSQDPTSWSRDDEIVFTDVPPGFRDIWVVPAAGGDARAYLEADYREEGMVLSPDGTLAAYHAQETGGYEIYVRGFPEPTGKHRISFGGGSDARWSPRGDELYFLRRRPGPDSLFAVPLQREPDFVPGDPVFLFTLDIDRDAWDVHPDGRFLVAQEVGSEDPSSEEEPGEPRYLVVLNWFEELRARLGEGRR